MSAAAARRNRWRGARNISSCSARGRRRRWRSTSTITTIRTCQMGGVHVMAQDMGMPSMACDDGHAHDHGACGPWVTSAVGQRHHALAGGRATMFDDFFIRALIAGIGAGARHRAAGLLHRVAADGLFRRYDGAFGAAGRGAELPARHQPDAGRVRRGGAGGGGADAAAAAERAVDRCAARHPQPFDAGHRAGAWWRS